MGTVQERKDAQRHAKMIFDVVQTLREQPLLQINQTSYLTNEIDLIHFINTTVGVCMWR